MTRFAPRCEQYDLGNRTFSWCMAMNRTPTNLVGRAEAPDLGSNYVWRVEWIRLYRNYLQVKSAGPTNWMNLGSTRVFTTGSYPWCRLNGGYWTYHAEARVQFAVSGGLIGPWASNASGVRRWNCVEN